MLDEYTACIAGMNFEKISYKKVLSKDEIKARWDQQRKEKWSENKETFDFKL